jgi:hypothetical protein
VADPLPLQGADIDAVEERLAALRDELVGSVD